MTTQRMIEGYREEMARLWPAQPTRMLSAGRGGRSPSSTTYRMAVVPNADNPRLLVAAASPRAASAALRRFSTALGARDVGSRLAYSALLRGGLGRVLPSIEVSETGDSIRQHLARSLGEPVELSLGLGTARANRKPVLEVFDRRGNRMAFAKIGTTAISTALVRGEAEALRRLAERDLSPAIKVPQVIDITTWEGMTVLLMTGLPSSPTRSSVEVEAPRSEAATLASAFPGSQGPITECAWWKRIEGTSDAARDGAPLLDDLLRRLCAIDTMLDAPLPRGAWHGDWTPWNQSRTPTGLALWDWERFEEDVPTGMDLCHFYVNAATRRAGTTVSAIDGGLRASGLVPDRAADARVAGAYLLTVAARYLSDMEGASPDARGMLERRSAAVLSTATRWLPESTTGHLQ